MTKFTFMVTAMNEHRTTDNRFLCFSIKFLLRRWALAVNGSNDSCNWNEPHTKCCLHFSCSCQEIQFGVCTETNWRTVIGGASDAKKNFEHTQKRYHGLTHDRIGWRCAARTETGENTDLALECVKMKIAVSFVSIWLNNWINQRQCAATSPQPSAIVCLKWIWKKNANLLFYLYAVPQGTYDSWVIVSIEVIISPNLLRNVYTIQKLNEKWVGRSRFSGGGAAALHNLTVQAKIANKIINDP